MLERRNSVPRARERRFVSLFSISSFISKRPHINDLWLSINQVKLLLRALLSLGTCVRMVPSPVVPMEIGTHALSTSENALTGR